jgi:flavorubredoxin
MPKVVILYDTLSGTTELLVKAVIEGLGTLEDLDLHLLKLGTKFSISTLAHSDAIIVGSPSIYGDMTPPLRTFLTNLQNLVTSKKLVLGDVKGAVFGSYEWDGGWHVERIEELLVNIGIQVVAPPLAVVDQGGSLKIHPRDIEQCRVLGQNVAFSLRSG